MTVYPPKNFFLMYQKKIDGTKHLALSSKESALIGELQNKSVVLILKAQDLLGDDFEAGINRINDYLKSDRKIVKIDESHGYIYLRTLQTPFAKITPLVNKKIAALLNMIRVLSDYGDVLNLSNVTAIDFAALTINGKNYRDYEFVNEVLERIGDVMSTRFELVVGVESSQVVDATSLASNTPNANNNPGISDIVGPKNPATSGVGSPGKNRISVAEERDVGLGIQTRFSADNHIIIPDGLNLSPTIVDKLWSIYKANQDRPIKAIDICKLLNIPRKSLNGTNGNLKQKYGLPTGMVIMCVSKNLGLYAYGSKSTLEEMKSHFSQSQNNPRQVKSATTTTPRRMITEQGGISVPEGRETTEYLKGEKFKISLQRAQGISECNKEWIELSTKKIDGIHLSDDEFIFCLLCSEEQEVGIDFTELRNNFLEGVNLSWNDIVRIKNSITLKIKDTSVEFTIPIPESILLSPSNSERIISEVAPASTNHCSRMLVVASDTSSSHLDVGTEVRIPKVNKFGVKYEGGRIAQGSNLRKIYDKLFSSENGIIKTRGDLDIFVEKINSFFEINGINQKIEILGEREYQLVNTKEQREVSKHEGISEEIINRSDLFPKETSLYLWYNHLFRNKGHETPISYNYTRIPRPLSSFIDQINATLRDNGVNQRIRIIRKAHAILEYFDNGSQTENQKDDGSRIQVFTNVSDLTVSQDNETDAKRTPNRDTKISPDKETDTNNTQSRDIRNSPEQARVAKARPNTKRERNPSPSISKIIPQTFLKGGIEFQYDGRSTLVFQDKKVDFGDNTILLSYVLRFLRGDKDTISLLLVKRGKQPQEKIQELNGQFTDLGLPFVISNESIMSFKK